MAMKALVCYESKYGNTERLAESIADEMRKLGGLEVTTAAMKKVDVPELAAYDVILLGGPTHFGGPTRRVTKFIEALGQGHVTGKSVAVFDTYLGEDFEKSVKRMEEQIRTTAPGLRILAPGLSIRVEGMKGPIAQGELVKCKDFARQLVPQAVPS